MSEINTGGPAFPREDYQRDDAPGQRGMTMHDYFAAKAMQAFITNGWFDGCRDFDKSCEMLADETSHIADSMIKARQP